MTDQENTTSNVKNFANSVRSTVQIGATVFPLEHKATKGALKIALDSLITIVSIGGVVRGLDAEWPHITFFDDGISIVQAHEKNAHTIKLDPANTEIDVTLLRSSGSSLVNGGHLHFGDFQNLYITALTIALPGKPRTFIVPGGLSLYIALANGALKNYQIVDQLGLFETAKQYELHQERDFENALNANNNQLFIEHAKVNGVATTVNYDGATITVD